jgi:DNA-binding transcriptional ArsR family regulator
MLRPRPHYPVTFSARVGRGVGHAAGDGGQAMATTAQFAEIAALAGDPARAGMLQVLMDGRALTATELAGVAGIAPQTASGHLSRMAMAGLIVVEKQGRHRYHRLATPAVAAMLESIMQVASALQPPARPLTGPRNAAMRLARTCYDHLAGRLGVALADGMIANGYLELSSDAGQVTAAGDEFLRRIGVDMRAMAPAAGATARAVRSPRLFCRPCLDWSERRPHLAGALGARLCQHSFAQGWVRRGDGTSVLARRALIITPEGHRNFHELFRAEL